MKEMGNKLLLQTHVKWMVRTEGYTLSHKCKIERKHLRAGHFIILHSTLSSSFDIM